LKALGIIAITIAVAIASLFVIPMAAGTGFVTESGYEMADPWYIVVSKIIFYIAWIMVYMVGVVAIVRGENASTAFKKVAAQFGLAVGMFVHILFAAWAYDTNGRTTLISVIIILVGLSISGFALQISTMFTIRNLARGDDL